MPRKPGGSDSNGAASPEATGKVVAAYGRRCLVELDDGRRLPSMLRGRSMEACVGDRVEAAMAGSGQLVVERLLPRHTLIQRSVAHRRKLLAANVDLAVILIGPSPRYAEDILLRVMIAVRHADVPALIVANKTDHPSFETIRGRLAVLRALGEQVLEVSVRGEPGATRAALLERLRGRTSVLLGESGMGKSSLLNLLVPEAAQRVNDISLALGSGRHTTTASLLFTLDTTHPRDASLIDTPGFQQFGIAHLSESERDHAFVDIAPYLGQCRFHNCRHDREPGCRVRAAAQAGEIDPLRYRLYVELRPAPA